jgi:hypothetical protein
MAVSLYYQAANLNRERIRELIDRHDPGPNSQERPPLHQWLVEWIEQRVEPRDTLDSLPGVFWHLSDAWHRQATQDVLLVHYDDLARDLEAEMRRLADRLGIGVPEEAWPSLVEAASFTAMRARAESLIPDPSGVLNSPAAFFRRGTSGAGSEVLTRAELTRYYERAAELGGSDLLEWLHRDLGGATSGPQRSASDRRDL